MKSISARRRDRSENTPSLVAAALVEGMSDAFAVLDQAACFTFVNGRAEKLLGQPADELVGTAFDEVFCTGQALEAELVKARETGREVLLELYFELSDSWLELRVRAVDEVCYVFFKDITDRRSADRARANVSTALEQQVRQRTRELERANAQLVYDSYHDALTGLPNRMLLLDRLETVLAEPKRGFAVLFLDFDRFKVVNDSLGHAVGDNLLVALGRQLRGCLRQGDMLARLGGDEFVILLEDVEGVDDGLEVARRIQTCFSRPLFLHGQEITISASIGVVSADIMTGPIGYSRAAEVLRDADVAMYQAKRRGRSCYAVFDTAMRERATSLLAMESDLRSAIARAQFEVHYQPLLQLRDRRVVGFEALVRWRRGYQGLVAPSEFIPIAEEAGFIYQLDALVMDQVCRQAVRWQAAFPTQPPRSVSVNLSGKHLLQPHLAQGVEKLLAEHGLAAEHLCLEITESVLMDNTPVVQTNLRELRALGVQLHIDDFGMGYSSLSYLQRFPAHSLKIDRSFVAQMVGGEGGLELVRTMITMGHNLGMHVVAEGVETEAQLEALCELGCDYAQGYLLGKPASAEETTALMAQAAAAGERQGVGS